MEKKKKRKYRQKEERKYVRKEQEIEGRTREGNMERKSEALKGKGIEGKK